METLLITPLEAERDALAEILGAALPGKVGRMHAHYVPEYQLTLACGGQGKAQFALQTQHLLDWASFGLVICGGAAGALDPEFQVGDVVIAETMIEHDFQLKFFARPLPKFLGDAVALAKLRAAPNFREFNLHFGIIASGDEDVMDEVRGNELRTSTGASAVAWEGTGGARACRFSNVPYLELRGITDTADHLAASHFEANLGRAMHNLAEVVRFLCNTP